MKPKHSVLINNQDGSILLITVVILILVTLLGIFATTTSKIEVQIAGNDKFHKQAFYNAEGGLRAVYSLIEALRNGDDPADFQGAAYSGLKCIKNWWAKAIDDTHPNGDDTDVKVAISNNAKADVSKRAEARVNINKLSSDMTGETIINRAGYEGLGKGASANWVTGYWVFSTGRVGVWSKPTGSAGSGAESQTSAILHSIR